VTQSAVILFIFLPTILVLQSRRISFFEPTDTPCYRKRRRRRTGLIVYKLQSL